MAQIDEVGHEEILRSKQALISSKVVDSVDDAVKHYNDWPNVAGEREPRELSIQGHIPSWVAGTLLRVGPAAYRAAEPTEANPKPFEFSHWFDGFTHVHKFEISDDHPKGTKVVYTSRGQVDPLLEKARASGFRLQGFTFGQRCDPCDSFFQKFKTALDIPRPGSAYIGTDNIGVSFAPAYHLAEGERSKSISITTDNSKTKEMNIETLEPSKISEQIFRNSSLKGNLSAAHPCQDPLTGDIYNYNLDFGAFPTYRIFKTTLTGDTEVIATLCGKEIHAAYMHSLFLTTHFVVLCIWPAYYKANGMSILWKRNILDSIRPSKPDDQCTWLVIDRVHDRGLVKMYKSSSMFSFHTTNAFEVEGDRLGDVDIVAELCQYESTDIIHRYYYDNILSTGKGVKEWVGSEASRKQPVSLVRYCLASIPVTPSTELRPGSEVPSQITEATEIMRLTEPLAGELPCINARFRTREHRYVYGLVNRDKSSFLDAVVKTDTQTGEYLLWECEKHTPGEPVFVANPSALTEDDGVLLVVVLDGMRGTSYLLVLDARNMREMGRAEADVPVGAGFHGVHLPSYGKPAQA